MLRHLLLALTFLQGLAFAAPAFACECSSNPVDSAVYLHDATLVFEGEVLDRPMSNWIRDTAVFRVVSPLKGRLGDEVVLEQSRAGNCVADFEAGERVRIIAYGTAESGYWTSACSLNYLHPALQGTEIWPLAEANRRHTAELGGTDMLAADASTLRRLIRWHAEYGAFEEGLDAVERLLALAPGDAEALRYKAQFEVAQKAEASRL